MTDLEAPLVCSLLLQAPPGEFAQVVRDLQALVRDKELLRHEAARAGAQRSKSHFPPVRINKHTVLVTHYNDLGGNCFFDPQDKLSFAFDHLSRVAGKYRLHDVLLDEGELRKGALHKDLEAYVSRHFPASNCCVFQKNARKTQIFMACIEAHHYQPSGCWNEMYVGCCLFHFRIKETMPFPFSQFLPELQVNITNIRKIYVIYSQFLNTKQ
uniref:F-actin-capping protein subunit alpha n=1 Tax=Apteryx owenii TaxID=8824 RepID=A0A8B9PDT6_APTOW